MFRKLMYKALGFSKNRENNNAYKQTLRSRVVRPLHNDIQHNIKELHNIFSACGDIEYREFEIGTEKPIKAVLVYAETMIDAQFGSENILKAAMNVTPDLLSNSIDIPKAVSERLLSVLNTKISSDFLEVSNQILKGGAAIIFDGWSSAVVCMITAVKSRAIEEPNSEPVVRGPRDGLIEDYKTNIRLVRRRINSTKLKVEFFEVGGVSKTGVAVLYLKGIANDKIVEEVRRRIRKIKIDTVIDSNVIEELISDETITLFPLVQWTERPDKVAGSVTQGKVAIFVDNSPMGLIVPVTFPTLLQASEDYYNASVFGTFVRILRFIAVNIALLLPALVVAVMTFHQELIPDKLFVSIINERQGLPVPLFVEVFMMEITFELLREAGARLPKNIGQAVSIVGGLVIGQASIDAGFVGPLPVVTVALTAIASFAIPNYSAGTSLRILRFILIAAASVMGGAGVVLTLMVILYHLCGLRSFGAPYLSPIAPWSGGDLKDTIVRVPWWAMITRPRLWGSKNPVRQAIPQGPSKPRQNGDELL